MPTLAFPLYLSDCTVDSYLTRQAWTKDTPNDPYSSSLMGAWIATSLIDTFQDLTRSNDRDMYTQMMT